MLWYMERLQLVSCHLYSRARLELIWLNCWEKYYWFILISLPRWAQLDLHQLMILFALKRQAEIATFLLLFTVLSLCLSVCLFFCQYLTFVFLITSSPSSILWAGRAQPRCGKVSAEWTELHGWFICVCGVTDLVNMVLGVWAKSSSLGAG